MIERLNILMLYLLYVLLAAVATMQPAEPDSISSCNPDEVAAEAAVQADRS